MQKLMGTSVCLDFLDYRPEALVENSLVPSTNFLENVNISFTCDVSRRSEGSEHWVCSP